MQFTTTTETTILSVGSNCSIITFRNQTISQIGAISMDSIGETLRSERKKQTRSLSEIASETRISPMYLEAIERDSVESLPGFFFYKSFVKQYASALGVNYETLAEAVAKMDPGAEPDPLPALSANYQPIREPHVRRDFLVRHASIVSALSVVLAIVATAGTVSWWNRWHRAPTTPPRAPIVKIEPQSAVQQPSTSPQASLPAEPIAPVADPTPAEQPPPETASKHLLNIAAIEKTWVTLRSGGKTIFRGVLAASETKEVDIAETGSLTTGNAAALEVTLNGKPLGRLGHRGQVRTILFSQGNAQILTRRRM